MPHLPTELLFEVLSLAIPELPCRTFGEWLERQCTLSSFALVHSSWTSSAKEFLWRERWILAESQDPDEEVAAELVPTFDRAKTKTLRFEGDLPSFLDITGLEWLTHLLHLRRIPHDWDLNTLADFARLPQLEYLEVWGGRLVLEEFEPGVSFPRLRRLALSNATVFYGMKPATLPALSPANMPLLSHLALEFYFEEPDALYKLFTPLFPQLTSLAIADVIDHSARELLYPSLHRFTKLAHLLVTQTRGGYDPPLSQFLADSPALRLDSLHLEAAMLRQDPDMANLLTSIVKGERDKIKISRVVLYGSKEQEVDISGLTGVEWRPEDECPFANFDGT